MRMRQLNSTDHPIKLLIIQSSDSKTGSTGEDPVLLLSKDDSTALTLASGDVVEVGGGIYNFVGHAHDRNTLGDLVIHFSGSATADPFDEVYSIVSFNPFTMEEDFDSGSESGYIHQAH